MKQYTGWDLGWPDPRNKFLLTVTSLIQYLYQLSSRLQIKPVPHKETFTLSTHQEIISDTNNASIKTTILFGSFQELQNYYIC